ncbi:winged helix-turn-helix transcriptional regulator [Pseudomonas corrugata]|uniref:winged helix-turn-helix transcriptional regulator n=1 Tax=Pseudomonas corrugata TaxID=47879 RepID=UPI001C30D7B7|nr:helix-turn-helix domain-containing protein [Pseudomonas corrugata]
MDTTNNVVPVETSHAQCRAVAEILGRIGDKWTVLVVGALSRETLRYSEIRRKVDGISQRMLTLTLKGLEQDGLVKRTVFPTIPPRVDYELTDLGRQLIVPLQSLYDWALEHRPAMLAARERFIERQQDVKLQRTRFTAPK